RRDGVGRGRESSQPECGQPGDRAGAGEGAGALPFLVQPGSINSTQDPNLLLTHRRVPPLR
ncbi:hypothetical protein J6590_106467, partial [Homalodisca vitripennis]